jgi:hypothetical protein
MMGPLRIVQTGAVAFAVVLTATLYLTSVSNAATAGIQSFNMICLRDYKNWSKKRGWKAVADTAVYSDGQGCGMSWEFPTKSGATTYALQRCYKQLSRRHPKSKNTCRITAVTK